jgi:hypothetical protein
MLPRRLRFTRPSDPKADLKIVSPQGITPQTPAEPASPPAPESPRLLRSYVEYDSQVEKPGQGDGTNWAVVWAIVVVAAVSIAFWAGVAWVVLRYVK